jgi:hypothetical protein
MLGSWDECREALHNHYRHHAAILSSPHCGISDGWRPAADDNAGVNQPVPPRRASADAFVRALAQRLQAGRSGSGTTYAKRR